MKSFLFLLAFFPAIVGMAQNSIPAKTNHSNLAAKDYYVEAFGNLLDEHDATYIRACGDSAIAQVTYHYGKALGNAKCGKLLSVTLNDSIKEDALLKWRRKFRGGEYAWLHIAESDSVRFVWRDSNPNWQTLYYVKKTGNKLAEICELYGSEHEDGSREFLRVEEYDSLCDLTQVHLGIKQLPDRTYYLTKAGYYDFDNWPATYVWLGFHKQAMKPKTNKQVKNRKRISNKIGLHK